MKVRRLVPFLLLLTLTLGAAPLAAQEADPLVAEWHQHDDALVHDGYNFTQSWSVKATDSRSAKVEFFVPEAEEHTFSFWAASRDGDVVFRLLGPDGRVVASSSGRKGEGTVTMIAPAGGYTVEITRAAGVSMRAVFGIKGAAIRKCDAGDAMREHAASPAQGFYWPYLLYVPKVVRSTHLLVVPNNTGFQTADLELLRAAGSCEIDRQTALAVRLGAPLLVPLFPRPPVDGDAENLYLHALSRASLETKVERFRRVDLQLVAMIDNARAALREAHVEVEPVVFLWGFSASASFAARFTMLHPDRVAAVAVGSPGGWPIAPVAADDGEKLPYPVGVADEKELTGRPFDLARVRRVPFFFYLGDQDENDSVTYRDSFSKADEELIFRRFGKTPASRWKDAERLYAKAGLEAHFALYPGAAHSVTPEMAKEIATFFETAEEKGKHAARP
jgi:predicted esterase